MTDPVRASVAELVDLGRIPSSEQADNQPVRADRWEALIGQIFAEGAITNAEAEALVNLLPEDDSDCYGVAWTLVRTIESAPGWPLSEALTNADSPWVRVLQQRLPGPAPSDSWS